MRTILDTIILIFAFGCLAKSFTFKCATKGLIKYISDKYGETIDKKQLIEIANSEAERKIKKFFRLK